MSAIFFNAVMLDLHHELLDHLCSPTVHGVIPLLHVNRHFRQLAIDRLVNELKSAKVYKIKPSGDQTSSMDSYIVKGGPCVKINHSNLCWQNGAMLTDDPRCVVANSKIKSQQSFIFSSIDRENLKVTLKPVKPYLNSIQSLMWIESSDGHTSREIRHMFDIVSTGWFRPAGKESKTKLFGLELAARPDRFPECGEPAFVPKFAEPEDSTATVFEQREPQKGWKLEYTTIRYDLDPEFADLIEEDSDRDEFSYRVPNAVTIEKFEIPLINMFVPPRTCDEKDYYEEEGETDEMDLSFLE